MTGRRKKAQNPSTTRGRGTSRPASRDPSPTTEARPNSCPSSRNSSGSRGTGSRARTATPPLNPPTPLQTYRAQTPTRQLFPRARDNIHGDLGSPDTSDSDAATSSDSDSDSPMKPPVLVSPIKPHRRQPKAGTPVHRLDDLEVWHLSDEEIIEASLSSWTSPVYDHFDISLERELNEYREPFRLHFIFTCREGNPDHPAQKRARMNSGHGTKNLITKVALCTRRSFVTSQQASGKPESTIPYSEAAHRALIALRCAKEKRPFKSVEDSDYRAEVQMLRPGTSTPSAPTVWCDMLTLYAKLSEDVREYFMKLGSSIHLVLDGWTAPIVTSYLGIVVIWYTEGRLHRAVLEFIRLTKKHTGQYLAQVVADCIKRFGLESFLQIICMDNASNCDVLARSLPTHLPAFLGMAARARCFPHIINLIVKLFLSFFFKCPRTKRSVKVAAGGRRRFAQMDLVSADAATEVHKEGEIIVSSGSESEDGEDNVAAIEEDDNILEAENQEDDGKITHDNVVICSLHDQAIAIMAAEGLTLTALQRKEALQLFPRVSGLARRVHDSTTLKEKFDDLISKDKDLNGERRTLTRRVATRWNSDLACLDAHIHFRSVIEQLTAVSANKLSSYRLNDRQWALAHHVWQVLMLFLPPTQLFSQAEVPLIVDVIPMLEKLERSLLACQKDENGLIKDFPVIRVAAQAALLLIEKYSMFTAESELYLIAVVMCPDRKLKWFKDHGRNSTQTKEIKTAIVKRWKETYAHLAKVEDSSAQGNARERSVWEAPSDNKISGSKPFDSIERYLADLPINNASIIAAGGYIKYWTGELEKRPSIARMALDYTSALASSVDAERAFSAGRLQISHLPHNMSSQTFKARVAVSSWAKTPLFKGMPRATAIIKEAMGDSNDSESEDEEDYF